MSSAAVTDYETKAPTDEDESEVAESDKEQHFPLSQASSFGGSQFEDCSLLFPFVSSQGQTLYEEPGQSTQTSGTLVCGTDSANSSTTLGKRSLSTVADVSESERPNKLAKTITEEDNTRGIDFPLLIAPSHKHELAFEARRLPFGCRYEIVRAVTDGRVGWDDIPIDELDSLSKMGTNASSVPLTRIFLRKAMKKHDDPGFHPPVPEDLEKSPWVQLDKEENALRKEGGGLASLGFDPDDPHFFGGKVVFRASLTRLEDGKFAVKLKQAERGPSSRFTRRFGSLSFLRISLSRKLQKEDGKSVVLPLLQRPFILLGQVFRAFFADGQTVFFFRTNEKVDATGRLTTQRVPERLSLFEFLNWHNPLEHNSKQLVVKWATRMKLGLSTSAPGLILRPEQIIEIPDVISSEGSDMTDGCGMINKSALRRLHHFFNWDTWPTAIQVRIAGFKGLLTEARDNVDTDPLIQPRSSMKKITYGPKHDNAMLIIDVLSSARPKIGGKLSIEIIINLHHNGVPIAVFRCLLKKALLELVASLTTWEGPDAMEKLWLIVAKLGGVFPARVARLEAALARVNGYVNRHVEVEDEDEDKSSPQSTAGCSDEASGCPFMMEEMAMCLLDAGFKPQTCAILKSLIGYILKAKIISYAEKYRMEIPMSFTAFLVPDETGVLEPGEIFFQSSRHCLPTPDGTGLTNIYVGGVCLTRHPCKLPSDIQKWKAVDRPELRHICDVIVLSVKGERRSADFLSGGDFDGDTGQLIYDPAIVEPFRNSDLKFATPPENIMDNFETTTKETIADLVKSIKDPRLLASELQAQLLSSATEMSQVGQYSNMHEVASYKVGYDHPKTIRLAYLFSMCLDSHKTGVTLLDSVFKADRREYQSPLPWKENPLGQQMNAPYARRPLSLGTFIMDALKKQAKQEEEAALVDREARLGTVIRQEKDHELAQPYETQRALAVDLDAQGCPFLLKGLELVEKHVMDMYTKYGDKMKKVKKRDGSAGVEKPSTGANKPLGPSRQEILQELSREFVSRPLPHEVGMDASQLGRVRASFAYIHDGRQKDVKYGGWSRFPWHMAMRELGHIKASANGKAWKTLDENFYMKMALKQRHL
ncbi:RNA dependent RNA polymerase-domain-containing protein [Mycena floridula]|nr:RNA dependent RNA polymerase-domain-containing protein [Mycena floridula]